MRYFILIGALIAALSCGADEANPEAESSLLIENAYIIDGTGTKPMEGLSLLIRDGRIAAIGRGIEANGVKRLDATGMTLLPGLIDAHVHLGMVPGAGQRDDAAELTEQLMRHHLRAYLANGVTTVLDAGIPTRTARQFIQWIDEGHPGPRILMLSPFLTAPGGYLADPSGIIFFPPVETPQDIEDRIRNSEGLPVIGIKVPIERGYGPAPVKIHSPDMRLAITEAAGRHGLPIYIHSTSEEEADIGIEMGAHALMHAIFVGDEPSAEFIERVRESGAYLVPTFSNRDAWLIAHEPERLDGPLIQLSVPAVELETARDPDSMTFLARFFARNALGPGATEEAVRESAAKTATLDWARDRLRKEQDAVRGMHLAGVPIVLGSDSGNFPIVPYVFHGPTTLRELLLMEDAGLTRMEVIEAATRVAAEMLGIIRDVGTVEVGKCADLLLLRSNPFDDMSAFYNIAWTVRAGVARTPEQWMATEAEVEP
uniref:Imidazolonepropionase n=1 Tax=Candidatus Kentrum sp. FW TaxID=2126338 RepID=A0A450U054_9GAMM|nr:MAG: Imidazolonepropionase [Candidatus Kentron sp. FW]